MSPVFFLVVWLATCGALVGIVVAGINYDRVALTVLRAINAPVYEEARMIAALIYQHPEQWNESGGYRLKHPKVGTVKAAFSARSIELDGPYGQWEPNVIERLIIWDAVQWYRRAYIKSLLRKEIA